MNSSALAQNNLVKARLIAIKPNGMDSDADTITFMFNPSELSFDRSVNLNRSDGSCTTDGIPLVSFGSPEPWRLTLNNITLDTYETRRNVYTDYIAKFRKTVMYEENLGRPLAYRFIWGHQIYFNRCFVQSISYKLTLFLPDGTPVRGIVNLTILEVANRVST